MAAPQCMSNDGNQAAFIGTYFANGDTVTLCDDCYAGFIASQVCALFGLPADELEALINAHADEQPADAIAAAAEQGAPPAMLPDAESAGTVPAPAPADTDQDAMTDPTPAGAGDPAVQEGTGDAPAAADTGEQDESPPAADAETAAAGS